MTTAGVVAWTVVLTLLAGAIAGIGRTLDGSLAWDVHTAILGAIVGLVFGIASGSVFRAPRAPR